MYPFIVSTFLTVLAAIHHTWLFKPLHGLNRIATMCSDVIQHQAVQTMVAQKEVRMRFEWTTGTVLKQYFKTTSNKLIHRYATTK